MAITTTMGGTNMGVFASAGRAALAWLSLVGQPAFAGTFVYVSNAEDGDVGVYAMGPDGELKAGARAPAAKLVMPMAVSPDRRFLYAGVRSKPLLVIQYAIDARSGALQQVERSPLAD